MKHFSLSRTFIFFAFALFCGAAQAPAAITGSDCIKRLTAQLAAIHEKIYAPSEKMLREAGKTASAFYHGRLRQAFEAVSEETLQNLFDPKKGGLSQEGLEDLFWAIKSGAIKTTEAQDQFVADLRHLVDDYGPVFWTDQNKSYEIRQALRRADADYAYPDNPDVVAIYTDRALAQSEVNILSRALGEHALNKKYPNSKWYDRIARFFSPYYQKAKEILQFNNQLRRRLQLMYKMDEPVEHAISRYTSELDLNDAEKSRLKALVSDTSGQMEEVRKTIQTVYGKEISLSDPLDEASIRVRDLHKKLKAHAPDSEFKAQEKLAEQDMDVIDEVVGGARRRKGMGPRPMEEYHDVHLQVRNAQHKRETGVLHSHYLNATGRSPRDSNYDVVTKWTVTVSCSKTELVPVTKTRTNSSGKTETYTTLELKTKYWTESYSMTRDDVLNAKYEEVLQNKIEPNVNEVPELPPASTRGIAHANSATNGAPWIESFDEQKTKRILALGEQVRASENPYRARINDAISQLSEINPESYPQIRDNVELREKNLAALANTKRELQQRVEVLSKYQKADERLISSQWKNDKPEDFAERNLRLVARYNHMINRIDHLYEQIRRQAPSLEIEYKLPSYETQLAALNRIRRNNRIIQTVMGTGTVAAGVGYFVYQDEVNEFTEDKYEKAKVKYQELKDWLQKSNATVTP
ncbi:MAG: hypothetical protein AB1540_02945 [Bdellovibrionota bacterium]